MPRAISDQDSSDSQAIDCKKYGPYAGEADVQKYQNVYYQRLRGYPKELTVADAISEFNAMAGCHPIGKNEPPLNVEELLAAIRSISLKDRAKRPWISQRYKRISEEGIVPLGSYIDYRLGVVNHHGYDISEWSIYLNIGLDKYPGDIVGNPTFTAIIRKQYISSSRAR